MLYVVLYFLKGKWSKIFKGVLTLFCRKNKIKERGERIEIFDGKRNGEKMEY